MSGRVLTRLAPVVLVLAASLTACGGDGDTDPPAADQTATSSPSDSPSDSPSESPAESPSDSGAESDAVALTVSREGDTFTPNGERVELRSTSPWS